VVDVRNPGSGKGRKFYVAGIGFYKSKRRIFGVLIGFSREIIGQASY